MTYFEPLFCGFLTEVQVGDEANNFVNEVLARRQRLLQELIKARAGRDEPKVARMEYVLEHIDGLVTFLSDTKTAH